MGKFTFTFGLGTPITNKKKTYFSRDPYLDEINKDFHLSLHKNIPNRT